MNIYSHPLTKIPKVGDKIQLRNGVWRIIIGDNKYYANICPDTYFITSRWYNSIEELLNKCNIKINKL